MVNKNEQNKFRQAQKIETIKLLTRSNNAAINKASGVAPGCVASKIKLNRARPAYSGAAATNLLLFNTTTSDSPPPEPPSAEPRRDISDKQKG